MKKRYIVLPALKLVTLAAVFHQPILEKADEIINLNKCGKECIAAGCDAASRKVHKTATREYYYGKLWDAEGARMSRWNDQYIRPRGTKKDMQGLSHRNSRKTASEQTEKFIYEQLH